MSITKYPTLVLAALAFGAVAVVAAIGQAHELHHTVIEADQVQWTSW